MKCSTALRWLSARSDGELGAVRRWALARHLRACAACRAQETFLDELRARVAIEVPRYAPPADLRERLRVGQAPAAAPRRIAAHAWPWAWGGALAGAALALAAVQLVDLGRAWLERDALLEEAVNEHVRAALSERRIEVASSDQHAVKPWLAQRLDYVPPVRDLAAAGYALAGARLDTLQGQRVAVLVYQHRRHWIDVYVRPAAARAWPGPRSLRGFNAVQAHGGAMEVLAVSDLNVAELAAFVALLAQPEP